MATATMTSKGRVTVPEWVRQRLRLKPGDRVAFRGRPDGTIEFAAERVDLMSLKGILKPRRGVTVEAMRETVRRRFGRR